MGSWLLIEIEIHQRKRKRIWRRKRTIETEIRRFEIEIREETWTNKRRIRELNRLTKRRFEENEKWELEFKGINKRIIRKYRNQLKISKIIHKRYQN